MVGLVGCSSNYVNSGNGFNFAKRFLQTISSFAVAFEQNFIQFLQCQNAQSNKGQQGNRTRFLGHAGKRGRPQKILIGYWCMDRQLGVFESLTGGTRNWRDCHFSLLSRKANLAFTFSFYDSFTVTVWWVLVLVLVLSALVGFCGSVCLA
jgi:hypothetical protein